MRAPRRGPRRRSPAAPRRGRRRRRRRPCGLRSASSSARASPQLVESMLLALEQARRCRRPRVARRTVATAPWPGTAAKPSAPRHGQRPVSGGAHDRPAASGCSLSVSTAAAERQRLSASSTPSSDGDADDLRPPLGERAGLVEDDGVDAAICSSATAFLKRMPRCAPSPVPTMIAVGVARPSASGQVITTTVMAKSSAVETPAPAGPSQTRKVSAPPTSATRTSQKAARSARRCAGALQFCASCTSLTICASAVSAPTALARARSAPLPLIVAPISGSPGCLRDRHALAGDHRLVHVALALEHLGVDRHLGARPDQEDVADDAPRWSAPRRSRRRGRRRPSAAPGRAARGSASLAPPRARISNQWPSSTKAARKAAAS